jgi:transposase
MKALSVDLRERILRAYDQGTSTREEVAQRFDVSLGMVKKLLHQRRHLKDIRPQYHRCGRKADITKTHQRQMRQLLTRKPDMTLAELRDALELDCTLPAIHYVLLKMGLSYKKRRSAPVSRTAKTSAVRGAVGSAGKEAGSQRAWSSSTKVAPRPT